MHGQPDRITVLLPVSAACGNFFSSSDWCVCVYTALLADQNGNRWDSDNFLDCCCASFSYGRSDNLALAWR